MKPRLLVLSLAASLVACSFAHGATFTGLGFLSGATGYRFSHAYGVPADRSVVVGDANAEESPGLSCGRWAG